MIINSHECISINRNSDELLEIHLERIITNIDHTSTGFLIFIKTLTNKDP
jgi:hypothetical protein